MLVVMRYPYITILQSVSCDIMKEHVSYYEGAVVVMQSWSIILQVTLWSVVL